MSDENYVDEHGQPCDVCGVDVVNGMSPQTLNGYILWTCLDCYNSGRVGERGWDEDRQELI